MTDDSALTPWRDPSMPPITTRPGPSSTTSPTATVGAGGSDFGPVRRSDLARNVPGPARGPVDVFSGVAATGLGATISPSLIPRADWTFFTYVAADNDLAPFAAIDLQEMARIGSTPGMNVLALVDAPGSTQLCYVEKGRTRRIDVDAHSALGQMLARGNVNTGDPALLRAALEYVQREIPSSKFFLNL